jgi:hypothetical protein
VKVQFTLSEDEIKSAIVRCLQEDGVVDIDFPKASVLIMRNGVTGEYTAVIDTEVAL